MSNEVYSGAERLFESLGATHHNMEKIRAAYEYAAMLHEGQFRQSGEPYISHPVAVAQIAANLGLDTDSICAALLHDTVEDCAEKTDLREIEKRFGADVALIVDGLTKIVMLHIEDKEEGHIETLRKMLLAMSRDVRVIFIKLCDRLHNMRTLDAKSEEKQRTTALETMHVYAPLAHRLGMQRIKQELENISLRYLDPYGYFEVKEDIESKYGRHTDFVEHIRSEISDRLRENNIDFTLEGRIKSVYSVYKKMYSQNKSFDEIYDFYALRIIVSTELECYTALGLIHEMYNSMPGRFKDYISTPKPNLYRSLHTTVIGRYGVPFEVQIRTREMHQVAQYGIAAHWKYKSGAQSKEELDKKLEWVARLVETESEARDSDEFMSAFKTDVFQDETFVFTPKGDVITLPQGATVIDFAYAIHSAVGNKMVGAKINGMIVPIDRVPRNGEIVEIITSNACKGPSRDWLNIVTTGSARAKIRQWFKKERRPENIQVGRAQIELECKKFGKSSTEAQRAEAVAALAARLGYASSDDLYNILGYGGLTIGKVVTRLREEFDRVVRPEEKESAPAILTAEQVQVAPSPRNIRRDGGIVVDGEKGCAVKFAKCCNPLPGDSVIGFITKGFGISIHKVDCPNVVQGMKRLEDADRWVEAHWENGGKGHTNDVYEALVQIHANASMTILADVTMALADMKVLLLQINTQKKNDGRMVINLKISCKNVDHYHSIVARLKNLKDVLAIERGYS